MAEHTAVWVSSRIIQFGQRIWFADTDKAWRTTDISVRASFSGWTRFFFFFKLKSGSETVLVMDFLSAFAACTRMYAIHT